jgi:hypothetical protein
MERLEIYVQHNTSGALRHISSVPLMNWIAIAPVPWQPQWALIGRVGDREILSKPHSVVL